MIETILEDGTDTGPSIYHVKVMLDQKFYDTIMRGNFGDLGGIAGMIAEKIAEHILPEMEQRVFSDPQFKDRVIGDVLVRIANRLADKGFLEKEEESNKE